MREEGKETWMNAGSIAVSSICTHHNVNGRMEESARGDRVEEREKIASGSRTMLSDFVQRRARELFRNVKQWNRCEIAEHGDDDENAGMKSVECEHAGSK